MSAATVMRLVPAADRCRAALAILNGGNALATTIAAPLGSFLGQYIGWRGAFFMRGAARCDHLCVAPRNVAVHAQPDPCEPAGGVFKSCADHGVPIGMAGRRACSSWASSRSSPTCGHSWKP